MKPRLQLTPALTTALVFSTAWFVFWLVAFSPKPPPLHQPKPPLGFTLSSVTTESLRSLQDPTLFALPSENGFSGTFPADRINLRLSLRRPIHPKTYLPRPPATATTPDPDQRIGSVPFPQNKILRSTKNRTIVIRQPERIQLFFSPSLQARAPHPETLQKITTLSSTSVRIQLTIRPDGTVAHAFFETPAKQSALLSAVRRIRFTPAPKTTVGWLDIRFTPPAGETQP